MNKFAKMEDRNPVTDIVFSRIFNTFALERLFDSTANLRNLHGYQRDSRFVESITGYTLHNGEFRLKGPIYKSNVKMKIATVILTATIMAVPVLTRAQDSYKQALVELFKAGEEEDSGMDTLRLRTKSWIVETNKMLLKNPADAEMMADRYVSSDRFIDDYFDIYVPIYKKYITEKEVRKLTETWKRSEMKARVSSAKIERELAAEIAWKIRHAAMADKNELTLEPAVRNEECSQKYIDVFNEYIEIVGIDLFKQSFKNEMNAEKFKINKEFMELQPQLSERIEKFSQKVEEYIESNFNTIMLNAFYKQMTIEELKTLVKHGKKPAARHYREVYAYLMAMTGTEDGLRVYKERLASYTIWLTEQDVQLNMKNLILTTTFEDSYTQKFFEFLYNIGASEKLTQTMDTSRPVLTELNNLFMEDISDSDKEKIADRYIRQNLLKDLMEAIYVPVFKNAGITEDDFLNFKKSVYSPEMKRYRDNLKKVNNDVTAVLVIPIQAIVMADNSSAIEEATFELPPVEVCKDCPEEYAALFDRWYSLTGRDMFSIENIEKQIQTDKLDNSGKNGRVIALKIQEYLKNNIRGQRTGAVGVPPIERASQP